MASLFETERNKQRVANAINVLQACIYKSVKTGLFLKSLIAPRVAKFNMLMLVFTFKIPSSLAEKHDTFELDKTCGHK